MNFAQARFNMIEQQIRTWEVFDERVLDLLVEVPREDFVPEEFRRLALADCAIPLGFGEVMMAPRVEARMLQALAIGPADTIFEVGTGSGYVTALLARLGRRVTSVEIRSDFARRAKAALEAHGIANVTLDSGNGLDLWGGPYEVIALTGSVPVLPGHLKERLAMGGRMFVVVGTPPVMEARLITRVGAREWSSEGLFETDLPPLQGAPKPRGFVF